MRTLYVLSERRTGSDAPPQYQWEAVDAAALRVFPPFGGPVAS